MAKAPYGWETHDVEVGDKFIWHNLGLQALQKIWAARMPFIASLHLDSLTVDLKDLLLRHVLLPSRRVRYHITAYVWQLQHVWQTAQKRMGSICDA